MKIFSKEKCVADIGRGWAEEPWVNHCDGKPVVNGKCGHYVINDEWCIEKEDEPVQKYTMKDFIEKKIAVHCTNEDDKKKFLAMCKAVNLRWASGQNADKWSPDYTDVKFAYGFSYNGKRGRSLTWGDSEDEWYSDKGWTVVPFASITDETTPTYEIHIKCVGDITTAEMVVNGKVVKSSKTKRHPDDKFSFKTGAEYAFNRLFAKKEKEKREFKVGDKVKCVSPHDGNRKTVGKIGVIVQQEDDHYQVEFDTLVGLSSYTWWLTAVNLVHV